MRSNHDRGAFLQREADSRDRGADARVVGDAPRIVLGHIEICTDENPLAAQILVRHALEAHGGYFAFIRATATSSMRFEKPHSLSYQEQTLTSVPSATRVSVSSNTELAGLWLKSEDTSGSVL